MLYKNYRPHRRLTLRFCLGTGLALALALGIFPRHASAAISLSPLAGPTLQVSAGFDTRYQQNEDAWIPVQITLHNDGPDFNGKISMSPPSSYGLPSSGSTYQQTINLPTGAQKQVTVYIPTVGGTPGVTQTITVNLLDNNDQQVSSQQTTLRSLGIGDLFAGVLSNQSTGFGSLGQLQVPGAQVVIEQLKASTMPDLVDALKNFDLIILDNFDTASLSRSQLVALEHWIAQGGTLIVVGGPEWRATLSPLPADLLPVDINGTTTLSVGTHLFPIGGPTKSGPSTQAQPSDALPAPATVSTGSAKAGSNVLHAAGNTPLIVQSHYGSGSLYYLAFDPQLEPITGWSNASYLWKGLLIRAVGDQFLAPAQNANSPMPVGGVSSYNNASMATLLQSLFPNAFPATWLILILLLSYVLILGPVRLLLVRFLKKRDWSWRIALATIVIFSLLSYGLALQQKGTSIISSTISVIQLGKLDSSTNSSQASVATYVGVFLPSEGNFQVHIAGKDLVQSLDDASRFYTGSSNTSQQRTAVTTSTDGTNVELQGVETWTVRSLASKHETQVKGGIGSQLTLNNNVLSGSVTNTLHYSLNDAYVLVGNQYISLGPVAAGQTVQVGNLQIASSTGTRSIADQIAASHGLQTPYGAGYYGPQQQNNDIEQHMSMLSALSGETLNCGSGGSCSGTAPIVINNGGTKSVIYNSGSGGLTLVNGRDSLLLPNSPATLIGWADRTPDGTTPVTINGNSMSGTQESLVKAPLDITYTGALTLPPAFTTSQLVDIQGQGTDTQSIYPGIYIMGGTSALTFEYTLPVSNLHSSSLTVSEPANVINNISTNNGNTIGTGTVDMLHVYLYNWKTGSWDSFSFIQSTFMVNDAQSYIDPGGRVLIQIANQDNQGQSVTIRPWLELQGTAAS